MTDEFDQREWQGVHDAYSRLPKREPSAALDAAILAAARQAVAKPSPRPRWLLPLGSAAALIVAVGIGWRLREHAEEPWSDVASRAPAPAVAPAPPSAPAKELADNDKSVDARAAGGPAASDAEAPAPPAKTAEKQDLARTEADAFPAGKDQPAQPAASQPGATADTRPSGRVDEYRQVDAAKRAAPEPPVVVTESRMTQAAPQPATPAPAPAAAPPPAAAANTTPATRDEGLAAAGLAKPKAEQKAAAGGGEKLESIEAAGSRAKREDVELERRAQKEELPSASPPIAVPPAITDRDRERPRTWAAAIVRELDAGHRELAERETRALRERFPRYELPPRLAELIRSGR